MEGTFWLIYYTVIVHLLYRLSFQRDAINMFFTGTETRLGMAIE